MPNKIVLHTPEKDQHPTHRIERRSAVLALHARELRRVLRIAFDYIIDIFISGIRPGARFISLHPLEVHYAKKGYLNDHPIKNFIPSWDRPNLSATYFAMSILVDIDKEDDASLNWTADLALDCLQKLYQPETGGFLPSLKASEADFQSTYYAVKTIMALSELSLDGEYISSRSGVNFRKVAEYLTGAVSTVDAVNGGAGNVDINFSIFEKCFGSSIYLNKLGRSAAPEQWGQGFIADQINRHAIFNEGKICGFKLHQNDKQASLTATKSGLSLFITYSSYYRLDMSAVIDFLKDASSVVQADRFGSMIFNIYNAMSVVDKLREICSECKSVICDDCKGSKSKLDSFSSSLVDELEGQIEKLYYKGGFMFNDMPISAPNLYATRLVVEMASKCGRSDKINTKRVRRFVEHCYDMRSGLYRCYPYRSWYYSRNI